MVVFIAGLIGFLIYAGLFTPMRNWGLMTAAILVCIEAIMLLILVSIYRTRYVLTDDELKIRTTRLIGGTERIRLADIVSVEKTLIPLGLRLFGASFH